MTSYLTALIPALLLCRPLMPLPRLVLTPQQCAAPLRFSLRVNFGALRPPCYSAGYTIRRRRSLSNSIGSTLRLPCIPFLPALLRPPPLPSPRLRSLPFFVSERHVALPLASLAGRSPFYSR